uniref:Hypoxia-inducible factor 1-alpha n=2 Tax=Photinus pyralis TaxID=7054 RepID=A0A1Y1LZ17_PHOPY
MNIKGKSTMKDKRKNNEKRKEKSRDAARCRRSRETEIFTDLASMLPLQKEQITQLDKASVMRLAISYLRVRDMVNLVPHSEKPKRKPKVQDEPVFLKSLEGFLLVLSPEGDFIYLSENVCDYVGITQVDLMGQNIYEYSHPCDHGEIKELLANKSHQSSDVTKSLFIRLKCTLTNKGRSVNLKSATYKVIHCTGHMVYCDENVKEKPSLQQCFIAVGQPIPHPSNIEAPLGRNIFLSKHSLDMKFTYADDIMKDFLGYNADDLIGQSLYNYHHAMDSDSICSAFKCLFSKGQCETGRYRFLAKTGGYVWVLTQATLIYDKVQKPLSVVCVNYVISGIECEGEIYSSSQATACVKSESSEEETEVISVREEIPEITISPPESVISRNLLESTCPTPTPRPQTATSKIFAPRTEEMSKGFLMFSDEEPGLTMLKDEPDDLTHLAPVAGDVCVPLEDHPFLTDMLDDFLLRDNFGPLLTDEPTDPFISYRDSCDPSPQLLSPNLSKHSDSSMQSLNSPGGSLGDEDHMSTFMTLQMDEEDPELIMKAPYIPMNIGDDLPLLMSDDLIWNPNSNEKNNSHSKGPDINSSLAQLLCSNVNKSRKVNDHGGGLIEDNALHDMQNKDTSWKQKKLERSNSNKRSNGSQYNISNKRCKSDPEEKMSSELLQQLMSNNTQRGRPKGKSNWLLDSGQKATCISQPSDSVLMNLLVSGFDIRAGYICLAPNKNKC